MTTRVKLWQIGAGTDKAYQFSTLPQSDPTEWAPCVVEVEDWFVEKEDL